MTVEVAQRTWTVPTTLALWLPAGVEHTVSSRAGHRTYVVALTRQGSTATWTSPMIVSATAFVRGAIVRLDEPTLSTNERRRTEAALCDAIRPFAHVGLDLPVPNDPRVRRVTDALLADPSDGRTMADWGREVGASVRNLTRLFSAETGMTFAQWRLQARMRQAITALALDTPVGEVARSVGYGSTSAFVHAFRRTLGDTPTTLAAKLRPKGHDRSAPS